MRSGKFQASIASYIESYNTQMPHRTLKNLTPCQVEENSIEKAEWDIRVRTAWFFRFLCQIEAVWVFVSHIYLAQHFQKTLLCQGFQSIKQPHQIRKSHRLVRIEWGRSFWYARLDSNQWPTESESVTLSNWATGAYLVVGFCDSSQIVVNN